MFEPSVIFAYESFSCPQCEKMDLKIIQSLAAFPSTYFYAHFRISHKKTLDGNGKMCINSKNAHKKLMRTFE